MEMLTLAFSPVKYAAILSALESRPSNQPTLFDSKK